MTANQNFRVGVTLDLSAARRQFRRLEDEFRELTFQIGGVNQARREFESLDKAIRGIARELRRIDTAFTRLGRSGDDVDNAVDNVVRGLRRLDEEASEGVTALRRLGAEVREAGEDFRFLGRSLGVFDRQMERIAFERIEAEINQLSGAVRELRRVFDRSDDDARRFSEELRDVAAAMRLIDRAGDGATRATRRLNSQLGRRVNRSGGGLGGFVGIGAGGGLLGIGGAGGGFAGLAGGVAVLAQLTEGFIEASRRAAQFTIETGSITAEFDRLIRAADILAGGGALEVFTQAALEQGRRTIFTARESANALGELARAGLDAKESIAALPGVLDLAASDQIDLEKATLITARTLRAFGLDATRAGEVADVLANTAAASATNTIELGQGIKFVAPLAAQLGVSLQETAAAMGILGDNGFIAGIAGRALRRTLSALSAPTEKGAEALAKLGVEVFDRQGDFIGFEGLIRQLADAQEDLGNKAEFTGLVFQAFGLRAAPQLIALTQEVDRFGEAVEDNFGAFGRAAEIAQLQLAGLEGALVRLTSAFESERIESFIGTGVEAEIGGLIDVLRNEALPGLFDNVIDPFFSELAVGTRLLRTETLPDLIDAFEPFGEQVSEILRSAFDFIIANDEAIINALLGVGTAIQGIIDVFIGLGNIALPIISAITEALNALPRELTSALTGAGLGAGAGGLIGLIFGGPGGALAGAGIGAGAGLLAGIVGALVGQGSEVERRFAEFGVDFGLALQEGIEQGLDLGEAIEKSLRETSITPGEATSITGLTAQLEEAERRAAAAGVELEDLKALRDSIFSGERGPGAPTFTLEDQGGVFGIAIEDAGELSTALDEAERKFGSLTLSAREAREELDQVLASEQVQRGVEAEITRANAFLTTVQGLGLSTTRFRVEEDAQQVLLNVEAGFTAIERIIPKVGAVPISLDEATRITAEAQRRFIEETKSTLGTVVDGLDELTSRTLDSLDRFKEAVQGFDFGETLFTELPDFQTALQNNLQAIDVSTILDDEDAIVGIGTAKTRLAEVLTEIPEDAAKEALGRIDAIFKDGDLSVADRVLAGAIVADQAILEQRAQEFANVLTGVFERAQALFQEADVLEAGAAGGSIARFLPEEDAAVVRARFADIEAAATQLRNQGNVLLDLANNGDIALAQMALTSDAVLAAITANAEAVREQEAALQTLAEDVEVEIGVQLAQDDVQNLITDITDALNDPELVEGAESGGEGTAEAFLEPLKGLPKAIQDVFGISSPSTVMRNIGIFLGQGLQLGWDAAFPRVRTEILSDIEQLINAIERRVNNLTFSPQVSVTGTGGGRLPTLHSGGLVPGMGDIPINALGGEFMLRKSTVDYLSRIGVSLDRLNRRPHDYFSSQVPGHTYNRNMTTTNHNATNHEHHYHLDGTGAPRINAKKLAREVERAFVKGANL